MKRVGIRDVADRAGVAVGTVSRVLNDHPSVSDNVRNSVKTVIDEMGYRPDPFARSMRSKVSRLIGIVIPDLVNPFFAEVVQHAERAAAENDHNIIFMTSFDDVMKESDRLAQLAGRKVDGIILVPSNGFHEAKPRINVPVVVLDRLIEGYPGIAADHCQGAKLAADFVLGLGHCRIGVISGPSGSVASTQRLSGYISVLETGAGGAAPHVSATVAEASFDYEGGYEAGIRLLSGASKERPTAILASSDQQAIGLLRAAHQLGIPVPAALTVVGFDGIPLSNMTTPRLTTVRQPIAAIATAAVEALLGRRSLPGEDTPLLFECDLVEGETFHKYNPD